MIQDQQRLFDIFRLKAERLVTAIETLELLDPKENPAEWRSQLRALKDAARQVQRYYAHMTERLANWQPKGSYALSKLAKLASSDASSSLSSAQLNRQSAEQTL